MRKPSRKSGWAFSWKENGMVLVAVEFRSSLAGIMQWIQNEENAMKPTPQPDLPAVREPLAVATQPAGLSIESAFRAVVDGELDAPKLAVMKELLAMDAKRKFAAAFVELQQDLPTIVGYRPIPDKQGNVKFRYANFDDIDEIVRPICLRHGFTYAFHESGVDTGRVTVVMTLEHCGGHSREVPYSVRIGSGPPGSSDSQADVSGHTYAQRGALESGLSLRIVGGREDARMEGGPITEEQAFELERRVAETNSSKEKFLAYARAATYREIASSRYNDLDMFLRKKQSVDLPFNSTRSMYIAEPGPPLV